MMARLDRAEELKVYKSIVSRLEDELKRYPTGVRPSYVSADIATNTSADISADLSTNISADITSDTSRY